MRRLRLESGISVRSRRASDALRRRASMSAIGSVMFISSLSPARLRDARDVALEGVLPQTDAAQLEAPIDGAGTTADLAAVADPHLELRLLLHLRERLLARHVYLTSLPACGTGARVPRGVHDRA